MSQTTILNRGEALPRQANRPIPSCANISDALSQLGLKSQTLHPRIHSITHLSVWGPAYTVQCYPGATHAVEEALELAKPGDVLVIDGEAYTRAVLLGGLMSTRAHHRGIAGAVVDGAVRDVAELQQLRWPVFAAGTTPRSGTFAKLGQQQMPVSCGEVVVQPGDMIAGDEDGIVAIPRHMLDETLQLAWEIEHKEAYIAKALRSGFSLSQAVQEYKRHLS